MIAARRSAARRPHRPTRAAAAVRRRLHPPHSVQRRPAAAIPALSLPAPDAPLDAERATELLLQGRWAITS
eukprot:gene21718-22751_t